MTKIKVTLAFASGRTVEIEVAPEDIESGVLIFRDTRIVAREYAFQFTTGIARPRFEEVRVAWLTADNAPALADVLKRSPSHPQGRQVLATPPPIVSQETCKCGKPEFPSKNDLDQHFCLKCDKLLRK